jgi:glycosyltransferase involved in cell wall biosynthesis
MFDVTPLLSPSRVAFDLPSLRPDDGAGPVILHVNPPELQATLAALGARRLAGRRLSGVWLWERTVLPPSWVRRSAYLDEVWAVSKFNAETYRTYLSTDVIETGYPLGASASETVCAGKDWRTALRLGGRFVVLATADPASSLTRKNPAAAISAFRLAFEGRDDVRLVLKVTARAGVPNLIDTNGDERIIVLSEFLSPEDNDSLLAMADCVLNLHRSEGYGLLPARALARGTPAITTAWSGVMSYSDCPGFLGTGFDLVPVRDPHAVYAAGQDVWAEPRIGEAAMRLREVAGYGRGERDRLSKDAREWWRRNGSAAAFLSRLSPATTAAIKGET